MFLKKKEKKTNNQKETTSTAVQPSVLLDDIFYWKNKKKMHIGTSSVLNLHSPATLSGMHVFPGNNHTYLQFARLLVCY